MDVLKQTKADIYMICDLGFASARNIRQLAELGYMGFLGLE